MTETETEKGESFMPPDDHWLNRVWARFQQMRDEEDKLREACLRKGRQELEELCQEYDVYVEDGWVLDQQGCAVYDGPVYYLATHLSSVIPHNARLNAGFNRRNTVQFDKVPQGQRFRLAADDDQAVYVKCSPHREYAVNPETWDLKTVYGSTECVLVNDQPAQP